ncbi:MAG: (2E,6E)-farnesyl diphosphate synthase [Bacteroidetes bacterium ADurb.BinA245]|jgi:geranylgeranyl diphosphate synthase type II|nr:polyprenyl synthetase family protein [Chitinophagaceae bacterium]OPZ18318.1 MAG: (2E,6E)-farnesyl diphosphate synthase [Bacteroidetes bacterium ADurb.BinA245]HMX77152.1 polyprenyl synthetase family protein [Chitinophagaceae bacterium]HND94947.1 polyprenyl synthetase family protein [Chitinophagaceae bacterium]HNL59904.1 polyprenyl synthetase family protein [Chitinophagaceae bacterium]
MQSFEVLAEQFSKFFSRRHFPAQPASLYDPNEYFLHQGGKRIRPVLCLMGNEMFDDIKVDAWHVGTSIELFHNFTLIHDDIMDKAPVRRGKETVHEKFGTNTAILAGDVMLVSAYEELNKIGLEFLRPILTLFNKTAKEVCEGQQMDMDFEKMESVSFEAYIKMIELKTSVALAASLQTGAILGGAGERNQHLLYEFGRKLGIAFQVQDDYLDAFGDPAKFGKQMGGDILANKKTFLLIHTLETAAAAKQIELKKLLQSNTADKIVKVQQLYKDCNADKWALQLKQQYLEEALKHLEDIAVLSKRKEPLRSLAHYLIRREY